MNKKKELEERLSQIVNSLESMDNFIDDLGINIPESAKEVIKKTIYSKEIEEIIDGINEKRPPRLALIGRSGVGKSSLINAITGSYLAETSAVDVGTESADLFQYKEDGEIVFEIIDTRGFKENVQATTNTAEEALAKAIDKFEPDAFLMLNNGADRTTLKEDAILLKKMSEEIKVDIPIVTIITRVDALQPARIKDPANYTQNKLDNIQEKVKQAETVLNEVGINHSTVIPVSAYIEWSHESPETLTPEEQAQLVIEFDGRYNIETLIEYLEENIDFRAALYMMLNYRIDQAIKKIANRFVKVFSTISGTVALTPIPASDIFVLVPIQLLQVNLIAYLNGIQLDVKAARDFLLSLGGVTLFGIGFRFVAQQGVKYVNLVIPGGGSVVSSGIAYSGTYAVGQAAILYYIEGKSEKEVKEEIEKQEKEIETNHDFDIKSKIISLEKVEDKEVAFEEEKNEDDKEQTNIYDSAKEKVQGFFKGIRNKKDGNNN